MRDATFYDWFAKPLVLVLTFVGLMAVRLLAMGVGEICKWVAFTAQPKLRDRAQRKALERALRARRH